MALQFLTTDLTTTFTDESTDDIIVPAGVIRGSFAGGDSIVLGSSSARTVIVDGTVYGEDDGIQLRSNNLTPDGSLIRIGTTGSVQSVNTVSSDAVAIDLTDITGLTIVNFGLLAGNEAVDGGDAQGDIRITNGGVMEGLARAIDIGSFVTSFYLSNSGEIHSSEGDGVDVDSDNTTILNSGLISALDDAVILNGAGKVVNSGTIEAGDSAILGSSFAGTRVVVNSGQISGAVSLGPDADVLANSGTIIGDIDLQGGDDHLDTNGGVINGAVSGGDGNDTLAGGDGSDDFFGGTDADTLVGRGGDDLLKGGSGDDVILGGVGNDELHGGLNNDTVNGNAGDDTIYGDSGNDLLVGQDGSDVLYGGVGLDTLDGGNGDDILEGGDDNDILRGRAGEDDLAGGLGRDFLTGGQDADNFVFRALAETAVGANRDQILDFEQGVDLIVVAGLSPGVFEFRGTAAFDSSGNPELRLVETATGSTIVQFDADGNGIADAEIRVANVTGLTADDFVL